VHFMLRRQYRASVLVIVKCIGTLGDTAVTHIFCALMHRGGVVMPGSGMPVVVLVPVLTASVGVWST
jgi:hypothetical protein